jgi:DNA-binding NarL/FixJ family response regulator
MKREEKQPPRKRLKVLIADASAACRVSLCFLISERTEMEVVGFAWTGADALSLVRRMKPDFVTLGLPELDGIKVLAGLQKERLKTTVIVLTGEDEAGARGRYLQLGAKHCFHKTTDFELVIAVLSEYAERWEALRRKGVKGLIGNGQSTNAQ